MASIIPKGLSRSESEVYQRLNDVVQERGHGPRPIVVITDVGRDYDNVAALAILTEFHRLGLVELRAVVANRMPTRKRPHLARAVLDSLGLREVPVARGTTLGSPEHLEELQVPEFCEFSWPAHAPQLDGQDLLQEVYENARREGEKLFLLCLSSLQDIFHFASKHPNLVQKCTAEFHYIYEEGNQERDEEDVNNLFNGIMDGAQGEANVTKCCIHKKTFVAPLALDLFVELHAMGHPLGAYLQRVQVEQDVAFYKQVCRSSSQPSYLDQFKWLAPLMDQKWFLANKTNWYEEDHQEGDALPRDEEIIPRLTKILLYNVYAAFCVAGEDVLSDLSREQTVEAISSLLKGSLLVAVCDFCDSIDFEAVGFRKPGVEDGEPTRRPRPIREVLQNSKRCVFCRKVAEYFRKWRLGKVDIQALDLKYEKNWAHYEMVSLDSLQVDKENHQPTRRLSRLQVTLNVWSRASGDCGLLLEFQKCSQHPLKVEDFCSSSRPICGDWERGEEQAYSGRIRPLVADTRLFRKWIETCCDEMHPHPHCGISIKGDEAEKRLTFMGLDGLRLVDAKNMCVVDDKGHMSYTALSYVWGSNSPDWPQLGYRDENRYLEQNSLMAKDLPRTIADAIELTNSLGYQYIWIDRLCIMQDDDIDQRYFIPQMDVIFGCAVFTIVAASGDANAGLPGIKPGSRMREQAPFMVKGVSLVRTLDPEASERRHSSFYGYLKDSEWCKRGWTFQEKLLSKRALIFTEEQVYFECQEGTWCEDGFWETVKAPTVYRHCFGDKDFCHPWRDNFEMRYRKMVDEYSGRKLTCEKDRRDAFEGILQRFQWDAKRGHVFLWALPKRFLSNALTWRCEELCPERRQQKCPVKPEFDKRITQCHFPSWAWLGWEGKVCFSTAHGRLDARTVDLVFYYFSGSKLLSVNQTGATHSLSAMGIRKEGDQTIVFAKDIPKSIDRYLVLENDHQSNILFFWSSTAKLHVERRRECDPILRCNGKVVPACFWFHRPTYPPCHDEVGCEYERSAEFEFVVIGMFAEYRIMENQRVSAGSSDNELPSNTDRGLLAVLLVSWEDGVAYREGLVHIDPWDWIALAPIWKLIMLG